MNILTVFISASIMGVQPRNLLTLDLDFGITNSDSNEGGIFQIDFGSEPP